MASFGALSAEVILNVLLQGDDWRSVLALSGVSRRLRDIVGSDMRSTYTLNLAKQGMVEGGSRWPLKRRVKAIVHYRVAAAHSGRYPEAITIARSTGTRHVSCCDGSGVVAWVVRPGRIHARRLASPIRGIQELSLTPPHGVSILSHQAKRALGGQIRGLHGPDIAFCLQSMVLDLEFNWAIMAMVMSPTEDTVRVAFAATELVPGHSSFSRGRQVWSPGNHRVCRRDFMRNSHSMCARGGMVMYAAIERKGTRETQFDRGDSENETHSKRLYVASLSCEGEPSGNPALQLDRVVAATFIRRDRVAVVRADRTGPCPHAFYMYFEIYDVNGELDEAKLLATLDCPGAAVGPEHGGKWFSTGERVGLPLARQGPSWTAGAFSQDDYGVFRFAVPCAAVASHRDQIRPGVTVPFSTLLEAADVALDAHQRRPTSDWAAGTLYYGNHQEVSDRQRNYGRQSSINGSRSSTAFADFHSRRARVASEQQRSAYMGSVGLGRNDKVVVGQRGTFLVSTETTLSPTYTPCCSKGGQPVPTTASSHVDTLPWIDLRPQHEVTAHSPVVSETRLCGDALLEFPGAVEEYSDLRGSYLRYDAITYRPLQLTQKQ